jgi:hypothetical protein
LLISGKMCCGAASQFGVDHGASKIWVLANWSHDLVSTCAMKSLKDELQIFWWHELDTKRSLIWEGDS